MDFDLTTEQAAVQELAAQLLAERSTPESLRALEAADPDRMDHDLWRVLADAGLLALVVPEQHGGAGLGMLELCMLLREVGRRTAAVPVLATCALGALPLARFGSEAQQRSHLGELAAGRRVLTAALAEPTGDPLQPSTTARRDRDGWVLSGRRDNVPAGMQAEVVLVPAGTEQGPVVLLVPTEATGVERRRQTTTSGVPEAQLLFDSVRLPAKAQLAPEQPGDHVLGWMVEHATVAVCAVMAGLAAEAVRLTGEYTTGRQQFGRSIASFQAVTQRAADAHVDAQAIELTMVQAAWRLSAGLPADREVATAKYWAAAGGQRVVRAAQHLHGGMGVDRDYPLHRYFLLAKQLELFCGGATRQLLRLGDLLDEQGPVRS